MTQTDDKPEAPSALTNDDGPAPEEAGDPSEDAAPKKSHRQILRSELAEGLTELERPTRALLLSAISAGLDIGFSLFLMAVMMSHIGTQLAEPIRAILVANMYAVGFIFVVLGRSELFTEHTTLAVLPVLRGHATVSELMRLWGLVYVGNIIGAGMFAAIAALVGPMHGVIEDGVFGEIAGGLIDHPWYSIVLSGMLAGWLMGLLSWLVAASRDTISQIVIVWLITTSIGFAHLHHAIVGTVEVLAGLFAGEGVTLGGVAHFLVWTTLGNALGGVVFVALLKNSYASPTPARKHHFEHG